MRIDVIGRHQQAGRDREAGGAEAERHGVDVRDVDAGQLGAELFLGDRADRLAGVGASHDRATARARPRMTTAKPMTRGTARNAVPISIDVEGVGQVDGAGVGAKARRAARSR